MNMEKSFTGHMRYINDLPLSTNEMGELRDISTDHVSPIKNVNIRNREEAV